MARALRYMPDGFLAVDDRWRIIYSNAEAERILGDASRQLLGRALWDVADIGALEERCRAAAADGAPVGFDIQAPANLRWYHMRLVPGPTGVTVYFTDVTEKRVQKAERTRAAEASARRTALTGDLTEGLAQALTVRDVVGAVVDHVLPLFGATGLMMASIEGPAPSGRRVLRYQQEFIDRLDGVDVQRMTPAAEVLRDRTPLFVPSAQEYVRWYPHLSHLPTEGGKNAWAFLPLIASGRSIGYCTFSFDTPRSLGDEERALLVALAGLVAHAFERARLYDAEHLTRPGTAARAPPPDASRPAGRHHGRQLRSGRPRRGGGRRLVRCHPPVVGAGGPGHRGRDGPRRVRSRHHGAAPGGRPHPRGPGGPARRAPHPPRQPGHDHGLRFERHLPLRCLRPHHAHSHLLQRRPSAAGDPPSGRPRVLPRAGPRSAARGGQSPPSAPRNWSCRRRASS